MNIMSPVVLCVGANGRVLMFGNNITIDELIVENYSIGRQLKFLQSDETERETIKTAKKVRSDIMTMKPPYNFPYMPFITESGNESVPASLATLLQNVIAPCPDTITETQLRRVNSIAHDIIFTATSGRVKMAKHILLPHGVKSLTGNIEIVHILNRLGHGIAYSQLLEVETAVTMQRLEILGQYIPQCILSGVFVNIAWDNIDKCEETLSGEGSTHRVNGIVIQQRVEGPIEREQPLPAGKDRRRSVEIVELPLPNYVVQQRVGPGMCNVAESSYVTETTSSLNKDHLWIIARNECASNSTYQSVPSWTGFNIRVRSEHIVAADNIAYLTPIDGPATSLSTVWEVLNRSMQIRNQLNLPAVACVFDQALYAKAAEIVWSHPDKFSGIVLCMGIFHTICMFLRILGKRFADAGLRDILVETGIVAQGSVSAVLDGKQYNRGVRVHKIVYEALMRLIWNHFYQSLEKTDDANRIRVAEGLYNIACVTDSLDEKSMQNILENASVIYLLAEFNKFLGFLRTSNGSLSAFWMSYIDMVHILLDTIRASREGNWNLHLASLRCIIPWCFAYDHCNYARYLPVYFAQMSNLQHDHPEIAKEYESGGFSVQLSQYNTFGRIPVDQTIEETVNKDTKSPGGIKGFSRNFSAVKRHYITSDLKSNCLKQLRILTKVKRQGVHADLTPGRIMKDEHDVQKVIELLNSSWIDPFSDEKLDIISLSSGKTAPPKVVDGLLNALQYGEDAYTKFKADRLDGSSDLTAGCKPKFHEPLRKLRLKTFADAVNSKVLKTADRNFIVKGEKNLFCKMVLISQTRNLNMAEVFTHPLGPIPYELANADGTIRKNCKSSLGREVLKKASLSKLIPHQSALVVDGMAAIHRLPLTLSTFGEAADTLLRMILRDAGDSNRVDVIFDDYRDISIKGCERERRSTQMSTQYSNLQAGHKVQQWKKFLSSSTNKAQFLQFVFNEWQLDTYRQRLVDKQLFITNKLACKKVTRVSVQDVLELTCSHEEADTRILLHVQHAGTCNFPNVVVAADDTDVLMMLLANSSRINTNIYLKSGTSGKIKIVHINQVVKSLGRPVCEALPGMHAFTGCDSVSAFAGKGKIKAFKLVSQSDTYQHTFRQVGQYWKVSEDLHMKLEEFTCALYGAPGSSDINACRYRLFCAKKGELESTQLPPCRDCLRKHTLRANYQAAIWRRCLQATVDVPTPNGNGWIMTKTEEGDDIEPDWIQGLPAPLAVLELLSCNCKSTCSADCPCIVNGLKCTDMCRLKDCNNGDNVFTAEDSDEVQQCSELMQSDDDPYSDEDDDYSDAEFDINAQTDSDIELCTLCPDPEEELEVETMYLEDSYSDRNYSISHGWQILFYFEFYSCP